MLWKIKRIIMTQTKTGISQKCIVLHGDAVLLAIKRGESAPTAPGLWDIPGGELDFGEDPREAMLREIREECGLEMNDITLFDVYGEVDQNGNYWVTLAYYGVSKDGEVQLSYEHTKWKWVTVEEFLKLESPPKIERFVRKFLNIYKFDIL